MNWKAYTYYHFLGIGGIGMSGLARYFKYLGKEVSGYDKTETSLTRKLVEEGISVRYSDDITQKPETLKLDKQPLTEQTTTVRAPQTTKKRETRQKYFMLKQGVDIA